MKARKADTLRIPEKLDAQPPVPLTTEELLDRRDWYWMRDTAVSRAIDELIALRERHTDAHARTAFRRWWRDYERRDGVPGAAESMAIAIDAWMTALGLEP